MKLLYKFVLSLTIFMGMNATTIEARESGTATTRAKAKSNTIFNHNKNPNAKAADGVEKDFQQDIKAKGAAQEKKLEADAKHHVQGCTVTAANQEAETIAAAILAKKVHKIDFNKMFLAPSSGKDGEAQAGKKLHEKNNKADPAGKKSKKANSAKKDKGKKSNKARSAKKDKGQKAVKKAKKNASAKKKKSEKNR